MVFDIMLRADTRLIASCQQSLGDSRRCRDIDLLGKTREIGVVTGSRLQRHLAQRRNVASCQQRQRVAAGNEGIYRKSAVHVTPYAVSMAEMRRTLQYTVHFARHQGSKGCREVVEQPHFGIRRASFRQVAAQYQYMIVGLGAQGRKHHGNGTHRANITNEPTITSTTRNHAARRIMTPNEIAARPTPTLNMSKTAQRGS